MKKQRKEKSNKGIVLKSFIKALIISIVFVLVVGVLSLLMIIWLNGGFEAFNTMDMHYKKVTVLIVLLICALCGLMTLCETFKDIMREEKGKISKKFAEEFLPTGTYIEVKPKEGHLKYYHYFFYKELPKIAQYFAVLTKDKNKVEIVLKLDKYDEFIFLETVEKENFKDAYEVLETMESTE